MLLYCPGGPEQKQSLLTSQQEPVQDGGGGRRGSSFPPLAQGEQVSRDELTSVIWTASLEETTKCVSIYVCGNVMSSLSVEPLNNGHAWDPAFCPL